MTIDTEYKVKRITDVQRHGDSWSITDEEGWSLSFADVGFEPKVGDVARYYGGGIGCPVRGLVIDGKTAYYRTPAEQAALMKAQSEKFEQERKENTERVKASGRSEQAMRDEKDPWPQTLKELTTYIKKQVEGEHDYGTCVYAMSLASVATFHYVAHELGVTGFQASCADFDILRRTRSLKGPFMLIDAEDMLYPQYDIRAKVNEALMNWRTWAQDEAKKKLAENRDVHPDVKARWEQLAEGRSM